MTKRTLVHGVKLVVVIESGKITYSFLTGSFRKLKKPSKICIKTACQCVKIRNSISANF
jgi:hypothetical protein